MILAVLHMFDRLGRIESETPFVLEGSRVERKDLNANQRPYPSDRF